MARTTTRTKPHNFLRDIDMFFQEEGPVHQTMRRLLKRLQESGIAHAVVGGMAVNAHGHERMTRDVDVLLLPQGLAEFKRLFVPEYYRPVPGRDRRFIDCENQQTLDFLITGGFPGSGKPGPIAYPDPEQVRQLIGDIYVADLVTIITLKLAARRYQDFADVVSLITVHKLDESFLERLHQSLHADFIECLEEKRREDEYIARNG